MNNTLKKIRNKLWYYIVKYNRNNFYYKYLYKSYWNALLNNKKNQKNEKNYFSAVPNPGAGIGHQMANWIAGYWFSRKFAVEFAHIPFSSKKWESFLGFGDDEITVNELLSKGYRKVQLPIFDEDNISHIKLIEKIIASYSNKKAIFICEQDQFYKDQYGVINSIQKKFFNTSERKNDKLLYDSKYINIALHIRRGDIVIGQVNNNTNLQMRWQDNDYFYKVLNNVLQNISSEKEVRIFLFSQGDRNDFKEFLEFDNLQFCLDMNAQESFLHMVNADYLITSKSSFSYKAALLNRNVKISPENFWHSYPKSKSWILADDFGNLIF